MSGFDENEISKNSQGGTEITKRSLQAAIDPELLQHFQIIPSRVREIDESKIRIYHLHDMPEDPESKHLADENLRNRFHKFVFSSNWQLNEFQRNYPIVSDDKIMVLETPIEPIELVEKSKDIVNLVYFSTPQRGLELLVPVFEELCKTHKNIHLHVHSSFLIYGWKDLDDKFRPLYDRIQQHPQMTYHGFTSRADLTKSLQNAHILAYPCVWKETSCRVLMESMSAGLLCVHPNLAALSDTAGGVTSMYQYQDNPNSHANVFYQYLEHAIGVVHMDEIQRYLKFVKAYADTRFNLEKISKQWEHTLRELLNKYPTVESRKTPEQMFVYRTS